MEKKSYIVQSPMPISFDIPALNISNPNIPTTIFLSEQEVQILVRSVPNIKVVPVITAESNPVQKPVSVPSTPKKEVLTEVVAAETSTEAEAQAESVISTGVEASSKPTIKKSNTLSLPECKAMIKTLNSVSELQEFLSSDETRVTVKDAVVQRIKELSA